MKAFTYAAATVLALAMAGVILGGVDRDKRIARARATADACAAAWLRSGEDLP